MKLLDFKSARWRVLLVYDARDNCVVLDFMNRVPAPLRNKMFRLLQKYVPDHGAPRNIEKARHLSGDIWEFKAGQSRGPGLRVLYFQDGNQYICTHAFLKDQQKTPPGEIDSAENVRLEYLQAKQLGQIEIETLEQ